MTTALLIHDTGLEDNNSDQPCAIQDGKTRTLTYDLTGGEYTRLSVTFDGCAAGYNKHGALIWAEENDPELEGYCASLQVEINFHNGDPCEGESDYVYSDDSSHVYAFHQTPQSAVDKVNSVIENFPIEDVLPEGVEFIGSLLPPVDTAFIQELGQPALELVS